MVPLHYTQQVMADLFNLEGKTALITGGSGTVGYALARGLGAFGAQIMLAGRTEESLKQGVAKLKEEGISASGVVADTLEPLQCQHMVEQTVKTFGSLDILLTAAGISRRSPAEDFPLEKFQEVMATNVQGTFLACQAAGNQMIRQGRGKIITFSSVQGAVGASLGYAAFAASKGGVDSLTRQLATEWAPYDIHVNGLAPGPVVTPETRAVLSHPEKSTVFTQRVAFGRGALPEELVGTAVYLASAASDFVTGQILYVDGGYTAG